ncbi:hypothetical protein Y032_0627g813 [Ancylostoma ceylanicum]|uniref:Uncharacterized protein n=1 Tax=Ancylostoma ceylanicum TaxID=53326 RepID=A0A016WJZ8_9BILA|nr:hypothetical protein Y032_0627g813 [Ancylostoma ceylanicum]
MPHYPRLMLSAVYSSHNDTNGRKSLVIDKHSFLLFISGFLTVIQNASNAFLAEISASHVKIVHLTLKSFQQCALILCLPSGNVRFPRLLLAKCSPDAYIERSAGFPYIQHITIQTFNLIYHPHLCTITFLSVWAYYALL